MLRSVPKKKRMDVDATPKKKDMDRDATKKKKDGRGCYPQKKKGLYPLKDGMLPKKKGWMWMLPTKKTDGPFQKGTGRSRHIRKTFFGVTHLK